MNYDDFKNKLDELGLSKQDFAIKTGLTYASVLNWTNTGKVAKWVKSWLELYEKAQNQSSANACADDELRAKAQKYDALKSVFNNIETL